MFVSTLIIEIVHYILTPVRYCVEGLGLLATAPNVVHVIDPDLHEKYPMPINLITCCFIACMVLFQPKHQNGASAMATITVTV